jgi:hypothetical protein
MQNRVLLTPAARARLIVEAFKGQTFSEPADVDRWLLRRIEATIQDAVTQATDETFCRPITDIPSEPSAPEPA